MPLLVKVITIIHILLFLCSNSLKIYNIVSKNVFLRVKYITITKLIWIHILNVTGLLNIFVTNSTRVVINKQSNSPSLYSIAIFWHVHEK